MIRISRVAAGVAAALLFIAPSTVSAQLVVGSGWHEFEWFNGVGAVASPFDAFTMTEATPFTITLVDAYVGGDVFKLSWSGSSGGSFLTSDASAVDGIPGSGDPDVASLAGWSRGSWTFGPGSYNFTLELSTAATGWSNGGGFIRADAATTSTVPEPATLTLMATGLAGLASARRRRQTS